MNIHDIMVTGIMGFDNRQLLLAHQLADAAGSILRRHFRAELAVEQKTDSSPVTQADREVEMALRALIEQAFPEHGIIGEEYGSVRNDAPYQWVLDPIDGTRAFIAGHATFTTLIALAHNGAPVLGLIDQPISKERWVGAKGEPTRCNGTPVSTHRIETLAEATLATTSTNYFTKEEAAAFDALKTKCASTMLGGDAYLYARLASGTIDLVVDASLKPYDFCALAPVIEGAGGVITDWDGEKLTLASDGRVVAAASGALHRQALSVISFPF